MTPSSAPPRVPRRPFKLMPARFIAVRRAAYIQMYITSDQATSATIGAISGLCIDPPFHHPGLDSGSTFLRQRKEKVDSRFRGNDDEGNDLVEQLGEPALLTAAPGAAVPGVGS